MNYVRYNFPQCLQDRPNDLGVECSFSSEFDKRPTPQISERSCIRGMERITQTRWRLERRITQTFCPRHQDTSQLWAFPSLFCSRTHPAVATPHASAAWGGIDAAGRGGSIGRGS